MRQPPARIGLNSFPPRRRRPVAGDPDLGACRTDASYVAGNLQLIRSRHNDDAVDAPPPVGQHALMLAAGAGIALRLKDQRRLEDGHCAGVARK